MTEAEEKKANKDTNNEEKYLQSFFAKEDVTIVITDIGLGGMSVYDYIENELSLKSSNNDTLPFKKVNLVYWNSQVVDRYTPHSLKVQINKFDKQLNMIQKNHNPDIILIACNTLSVIYNQTPFYLKAKIPILSIVNFGVELFKEKLLQNNKTDTQSILVIYGTTTTAKVGQHKKLMKLDSDIIDSNIDINKYVILQGCKGGATTIQGKGADSNEIKVLIDKYVFDSYQQIKDNKITLKLDTKIYAGLCCTHYGYSYNFWLNSLIKYKKEFSDKVIKRQDNENENEVKFDENCIEVVNPNDSMAQFITDNKKFKINKFKIKININLSVFSPNVFLEQIERESIAKLLHKNSANVLLKCEGAATKVLPKDEILKNLQQSQKL